MEMIDSPTDARIYSMLESPRTPIIFRASRRRCTRSLSFEREGDRFFEHS